MHPSFHQKFCQLLSWELCLRFPPNKNAKLSFWDLRIPKFTPYFLSSWHLFKFLWFHSSRHMGYSWKKFKRKKTQRGIDGKERKKKSNVPVTKKKREKYTQDRAHMFSSLSLLSFKIKESHDAKRSDQKYLELRFPSIPQTISTHLHNLNQGVRLVSPSGPVFDFATYVLQVCPPFIPTQKSR